MKFFLFHCFNIFFFTNLLINIELNLKILNYKEQILSLSYKKTNRIKEVKKAMAFPVYDGKTSIQVTVNREDAGCGKGKSAKLQIGCDGLQEIHLGDLD